MSEDIYEEGIRELLEDYPYISEEDRESIAKSAVHHVMMCQEMESHQHANPPNTYQDLQDALRKIRNLEAEIEACGKRVVTANENRDYMEDQLRGRIGALQDSLKQCGR